MLSKFKQEVELMFDDVNLEDEVYGYHKPQFLYLPKNNGVEAYNADTLEYSKEESYLEEDCMLLTKYKDLLFICRSSEDDNLHGKGSKLMIFNVSTLEYVYEKSFDDWI